ncbi:serine hydrolase domain-containing protein [Bacillaceae bacterium IKA-2]|nr:serine hydrolase domain-containing protein [Bacillaceae bacterium IKA-2]
MNLTNWSDFELSTKKIMKQNNIPGCAVAVSLGGEIIFQKGFGYRDLLTKQPVTPETIFGIASVTKSFTALAILLLEEKGLLSVDDSVIEYLPEFKLCGVEDISQIKISHLLSHTTGLAPMFRREELNKFKEHLIYLSEKEYEMLGKPGEYFSYCNDTYLLLGAIIEKLTSKIYRRHMLEVVLNPLNMYHTTMNVEELEKYENVTLPYKFNQYTNQFEEKPWPKLGNYEVGGGIRSTVLDLLSYGELYVNEGKELISYQTLQKMWTNLVSIKERTCYGYGFKVTDHYSNVTLVEHGGEQPGVSAHFGFIPEKRIVVAVLCNVSEAPAEKIWLNAVDTALGIATEAFPRSEPETKLSTEEISKLIGTYDCSEGVKAKIFLDKNRLMMEVEDEVFSLRALSCDRLLIEDTEQTLQFHMKNNEKAWALLFGLRMLTRIKSWVPRYS